LILEIFKKTKSVDFGNMPRAMAQVGIILRGEGLDREQILSIKERTREYMEVLTQPVKEALTSGDYSDEDLRQKGVVLLNQLCDKFDLSESQRVDIYGFILCTGMFLKDIK
jgi:hypothetical protein